MHHDCRNAMCMSDAARRRRGSEICCIGVETNFYPAKAYSVTEYLSRVFALEYIVEFDTRSVCGLQSGGNDSRR